MRRYADSTVYEFGRARGASRSPGVVYDAVATGLVTAQERVTQEGERLDTIAGESYGDASLWWIIAAASGIGWALQVPPGTRLLIPNRQQVSRYI
jgi:hypothetical protein